MEVPTTSVKDSPDRLAFGDYEFDPGCLKLKRNGIPVHLQEIPARLLQALVRNPGEVVTREHLRAEIWPSDTFVLFDAGLNTAMNKLRFALRDSASDPEFIETITRTGYRFIAPVHRLTSVEEAIPAPQVEVAVPLASEPQPQNASVARRLLWFAFAAILIIGIAAYFYSTRLGTGQSHLVDTALDVGVDLGSAQEGFALSPDGRTVLFHAANHLQYHTLSGGTQVWKEVDGEAPIWSPDGKEVAYFSGGKLWRRGFPDGLAHEICNATSPFSGSWGSRGDILFASGDGPIFKVSAAGGNPVAVTKLEAGAAYHANPTFLPDGSHFVYLSALDETHGRLMLGEIGESDGDRKLADATSSAVFVPRPHSSAGILVFAQGGVLLALPFDVSGARVDGEATVISDSPLGSRRRIIPASASANGSLVYGQENNKLDQVKIFDRGGSLVSKIGPKKEYHLARPSPDGSRIALEWRDPATREYHIDIFDRRTSEVTPLTGLSSVTAPVWSPDGTRLAVSVNEQVASGSLYVVPMPPSSSTPLLLQKPPLPAHAQSWSPDGGFLLLAAGTTTSSDIWSLPVTNGSDKPKPVITAPGKNHQAELSKSGRLLAYQEEGSGHSEVMVVPYPPDGRKWIVSVGGGQEPRWRSDGKELFYISLDYALMSVKVGGTEAEPTFEKPVRLFGGRSTEPALIVWHFEPSPGGNEFVVLTGDLNPPRSPLRLRLNWWAGDSAAAHRK